ncbi:MAG: EscU/YscU/HrcU family type III secretion system export apparatus switch protein [Bacillota bacterium]|nr:EscU/YscU/HrcU family type III secretion system export apparatus switch protein [Bacillota bacterium]
MDKEKMATALRFDPQKDAAPQVIAKGLGLIAENIIRTAKESDVPVYVDEKLTRQLHQLDIGDSIPPDLYEVVAEVLIFIASMDRERGLREP